MHSWKPITFLVCAAALFAAACDDDPAEPTPTATPSVTATAAAPTTVPTVPTTATPPRRGTVPTEVNTLIDLVLAGDTAALERQVALVSLPCGPQQGPGSPPACPAGQPAGTPVPVLPVATCEGELRQASAVRPTLEDLTLAKPVLNGVYRAPRPYLPSVQADYVAVFGRTPTTGGVIGPLGAGLVVSGGKVAGVWFGCLARPNEIVPAGTEVIFLPGG